MQGDKPLKLGDFLKLEAAVESGGHAKAAIQSGEVRVNGEVETRRGRKLKPGDVVEIAGQRLVVPERA